MDEKLNERTKQQALVLEFLKLELTHLLKSGDKNPKITEHCMKRIKDFLGVPEDTVFPSIMLGDVESIRHLAGIMSRIKTDIKYSDERIKEFNKELNRLGTPEKNAAPPPVSIEEKTKLTPKA
jgi:hypothetical protein